MPFATSDGVKIHYQVEGRGELLVLYRGLTVSGERWRDPDTLLVSATATASS